jgi:hypothetical protein
MDHTRRAVTLWKVGPISCTCVALPYGQIEICLIAGSAPFERKWFSDTEAAAKYAIEKMRAYQLD